jgi:hypothetical protein
MRAIITNVVCVCGWAILLLLVLGVILAWGLS